MSDQPEPDRAQEAKTDTDTSETRPEGGLPLGVVLQWLWRRIVFAWHWLGGSDKVAQPITLQPRGLRLLVLLILGNIVVLAMLSVALYRAARMPLSLEPSQQIIALATPWPSPTAGPTPTPLGSGGAIAFTVRRNANADIYALNQSNRQLVRLTYDPAEDRDPAWSPDANYIAFASSRAHNWDIYLLDLASGALIRLTRNPDFDANPSWSPNGRWIAFESYRRGNLDIYMMSTTGEQVRRITSNPAPDYAPAWSPDSRAIAFTSFRDGSRDVYVYPVDGQEGPINITHSPNLDEDTPAWSPDGTQLAYVSGPRGNPSIQITTFNWDSMAADRTQTELFGAGCSPAWAPDGASLAYAYQRSGRSHLVAASMTSWALFHQIYTTDGLLDDLAWTGTTLSPRVVDRARAAQPAAEPRSHVEIVQPTPAEGPPYELVQIPDVGSDEEQFLSDRVNESFNALRQRVIEEAGWDYLSSLSSLWVPITYTPPSGHSRRSWHLCGRAIGLDQEPYQEDEPRVELVREDVGNLTYWRVFIRAANQDGTTGEPLRQIPWDLNARYENGPPAVEGGALETPIPAGYYVDFTTLASDYGWERVPSLWRWRYLWPDIRWWEFQKTNGLTWWECMLEVLEPAEIEAAFGPIPGHD